MSIDETNDRESSREADSKAAQGDEHEPEGVFGNLPTTRPGARSPRRAAEAASSSAESEPTAKAATEADAAEPPGAAPRSDEPRPSPGPAPKPAGGGVEDVAWAGVAAAAEAATIGVRLATRALQAMRDAVDRR